ncbi:MAG: hypothetical protein ACFCVH_12995 [Alphaproteobacteria bacterium]
MLVLFGTGAAASAQSDMIDLPVNHEIRVLTYAYCLTGDQRGIRHVLAQRIAFTGKFTQSQAETSAAGWVASGYCADTLASAERAMPGLRAAATAALQAEGFNARQPITEQAIARDAANKGFFSWLAGGLRAIGNAISNLFRASGSGHYEYYESGQTKICDRQWEVRIGGGGEGMEPTPFFPEPGRGG